jgi:hypothetical protein
MTYRINRHDTVLTIVSGRHQGACLRLGSGSIRMGQSPNCDLVVSDAMQDFCIDLERAGGHLKIKNTTGCSLTVNEVSVLINQEAEVSLNAYVARIVHNNIQIDIGRQQLIRAERDPAKGTTLITKEFTKKQSLTTKGRPLVYKLAIAIVAVNVIGVGLTRLQSDEVVQTGVPISTLSPAKNIDIAERSKQVTLKINELFNEPDLYLTAVSSDRARLFGIFSSEPKLEAIKSFLADELSEVKIEYSATARLTGVAEKPQTAWLNSVAVINSPTGQPYLRTREGEVFVVGALTHDRWVVTSINANYITLKKDNDEFKIEIKRS